MNTLRWRRVRVLGAVTLLIAALIFIIDPGIFLNWRRSQAVAMIWPSLWQRPQGMAPAAFSAYKRACDDSKISYARIGQTVGNHPRSEGYHRQDGVLTVGGERFPYTAAVDLGAYNLNRAGINRFLSNLAKHGFAAWYRKGKNWKGNEHIHAVYSGVPMKRQLRDQVRLFLRERRAKGIAPLRWEKRLMENGFASLVSKGQVKR